jgi:hypothetical protein
LSAYATAQGVSLLQAYWEAAADSGKTINNAAKAAEAAAKQAAKPADNADDQATQGRGRGHAR